MPEISRESIAGDLGDRSGHLDAGGAATDNDKGHGRFPRRFIGSPFGIFESHEDSATDFYRVFKTLQAWCQRLPFGMAEVGMSRAGSDDKKIIGQLAIRQLDFLPLGSMLRTSARMTSMFAHLPTMARTGAAMSAGDKAAVAT